MTPEITLGPKARARLTRSRAAELQRRTGFLSADALLSVMLTEVFPGRIALVSSFGTESAVLLHMVAEIDRRTPVIFLDSGRLFGETLRYRDALVRALRLTDVRSVTPAPAPLAAEDPDGLLFRRDPERCCALRKVEPLRRALASLGTWGFEAWITGRKGYQGGLRSGLPRVEAEVGGRIKLNPLADWRRDDIEDYFLEHDLPRHPLEAEGYLSIGCMPCTDRVACGEALRAGRWRGLAKSECGIHLPGALAGC